MSAFINQLFSEVVKVKVLGKGDALTVAKYPTSGNFIDVRGVHRFAIVGIVNAVNSATTVQVQQATAINGSPKDITGAVKVIAADGSGNGKWFAIEVLNEKLDMNNDYKFITVDVSGPAGGDDLATLLYLELAGPKYPVTQGTDLDEIVKVMS